MRSISLVQIVYIFALANAVIGIVLHLYFDIRRDKIRVKLADPVSPYNLLIKERGSWLAEARSWIQFNCLNGNDVTWGSIEELKPPLKVRQIEELAACIAATVMNEQNKKLYNLLLERNHTWKSFLKKKEEVGLYTNLF